MVIRMKCISLVPSPRSQAAVVWFFVAAMALMARGQDSESRSPTTSNAALKDSGIYVINSDSSELRKLTSVNGFAWHLAPRWSHDGKHIAFHVQQKTGADPQVYVVSSAGGDPVGLG